MYRYLWSNGPKEALEFPDYTFEEHYGQTIPSFPPREVLFDYLQGRWKKFDLDRFISFNHSVKDVTYNANSDKFSVVTKNHKADMLNKAEEFDYVVNCSGNFSTPNVPSFQGIEKFPGRVLHAHDFRDAVEFKDKRLLIVGASYSAEDIALQCIKYGAKNIICSYRTKPMGFKWPSTISERPLLTKIEGNTVHFVDGSSAEVDAILLATGYLHHYPHLEDQLRLTGPNVLFPKELYKGIVWTRSGNGKFLYIGAPDEYYTFTMFDMQALWALKYIMGEVKRPERDAMQADMDKWLELQAKNKDYHDEIDYQTKYIMDLAAETKYLFNLDVAKMFHDWEHDKDRDILTYRDKAFASKFTGNMSPIHHTPFMQAMDDSMECFLGGHFSTPNVPSFPGIEKFPGRVLHAHDFRDAVEFKDKRLLIVGASYSAEDIALQCIKYGAKNIICSYRTKPMGFKWPSTISERPLLTKIEGNTVHFVDGSSAEVDAILLATGYLFHYPHLEDQLRLTSPNVLFPEGLYKGIVWTRSGNGKLLYLGAPNEFYTFTLFDMQALWALKYIMGEVEQPGRNAMQKDVDKWLGLQERIKDIHDGIDYQTEYIMDLVLETKYPFNLDAAKIFHDWTQQKVRDLLTYRDQNFASKFTGIMSPTHHTPFMKALDDSLEDFLGSK
ncbi:hypothetical protein TCAL_01616 [Tigriopus californicus]|uniref:Flavin-containing monooxygenase n=1 Tax=Tigriopus californicus TaxID=6832 RepID=A0A553PCJ2_TIGCA|nr:hypothetical protein TCAL_01616 [Tigriopus californicus]